MNHQQPFSSQSSCASAQVIALGELRPSPGAAAALASQVNPLHGIRTRLEVCVGEVEMTVGELLAARENEVVTLDAAIDQPIELRLNGSVVARGQLVAIDGRFGFRITELPGPLAP
jgi:flagellar motor switch protein FliN/FliY